VHIIPRHKDVPMKPAASLMEKPEVLAAHAAALKAALA
ncbi:MAG TPA: HIT family protein, partial [Xanthobacteraceae bacterium]|nr:HIT family protein [Xanthobacteraceae bacterium]